MLISYDSAPNEFAFTTYKVGDQVLPDVLGLSNGGFAIAYNNPDNAIRVDFFDTSRNAIGTAPRFPGDNGFAPVAISQPSLAQLANGNVLVVWDDNTPNSPGLRGHLYTQTGNPIGSELTFGTGDFNFSDPQVAALNDGDFVISYNYTNVVAYSVFDAAGNFKTGAAITPTANMLDPAVAALRDGGFVVTYTDASIAANNNIRAAIYNADGSVRKSDFVIDLGPGHQLGSKVAGLPNGNFAVAYVDANWPDESGSTGITLQIFSPSGLPISGFRHADKPSPGNEIDPDIAVLPNGLIHVSWARQEGGLTEHAPAYRLFDIDGNAVRDDILITGNNSNPPFYDRTGMAVSALGRDKVLISWQDTQPESDGSGGQIRTAVKTYSRTITGDNASDTFVGDQLADMFTGGAGNNTFVIRPGGNSDRWVGFAAGTGTADKVDLTGFGNIHNLEDVLSHTTDSFGTSVIDFGNKSFLTLQNIPKASLSADDFIFAPLNDFNGDGKSDVLFSLPGANYNSDYLWQMNDRAIGSQGALDLYDKAFNVQVIGDFDADGKSDVVFRNPTTGGVWEWLINDKTIKSQGAVDVADPAFALLGSADFNGDGKSDLLFRNAQGFVYMWLMDGKTNTPLPVGALSPIWHIAGAGDFDLDGKADLLLHNVSNTADNGAYFLWKMDGNKVIGQGGIERPAAPWHTLAVGDFDGDGKSDFAIRNVSATPDNGAVWVYLMDGTTIKSQGAAGIVKASEFNTVGVGDYNGDGKDDMLFRSTAGYFYSWDMNGTHLLTEGAFGTQAGNHADPSFAVVTQHWDLA